MKSPFFIPYNRSRGEKVNDKPNRLRELRKNKRWPQERLAIELNVTQATISLYETKGSIPYDMVKAISKLFGVSVDYLMNVSDEKYRSTTERITEPEHDLLSAYRELSFENRKIVDQIVKLIRSQRKHT